MKLQTDGDYEVAYFGWSGRPDPDGSIYSFYVCGGGLNDNHYCNPEVDQILADTQLTTDIAARKPLYDRFDAIALDEMPIIYLDFQKSIWGMTNKLTGFVPYPDGIIQTRKGREAFAVKALAQPTASSGHDWVPA